MKKLLLVMPLFALAACEGSIASAVGDMSGKNPFADGEPIGTTAFDPGEFDAIALAGSDNVVFTTGDDYSLRAEGDEDAVERLRYKLVDGQLKIGRESKGMGWTSGSATIYVSAPALTSAKLAGSGDLKADRMTGDDSRVSIAGSGDVDIAEVDAARLTSKIAGSGDMKLAGSARQVTVSIAGSGNMSAKELKADNATIKIAGSGDVVLSSDGDVEAKISGSGDIRVHGKANCTSKTRGSGKVNCG